MKLCSCLGVAVSSTSVHDSPVRILIVEDDPSLQRLIQRTLVAEGYAVDVAGDGETGRTLAYVNDYDGIILDMELGDRHGLTILQELRRERRETPVLIFSGLDSESDMVRGLDAGADDYVVKPVGPRELAARVRALVRRAPRATRSEQIVVGGVVLNRLNHEVRSATTVVDLTHKEYALLEFLMMHAGAVVSRTELLEKVWDMHFDPGSNVVDVHVGRLRRKLDHLESGVEIETIRGAGYKLAPRETSR